MKRLFLLMCLGLLSAAATGQPTPVTRANYDLAERFSQKKVDKMVFSTAVQPNWFRDSDKFWYVWHSPQGTQYFVVDPAARTRRPLWDMAELAMKISEITHDPFDAQHLPIAKLKLKDDRIFTFEITGSQLVDKKPEAGKEDDGKKPGKERKVFRFEYDLTDGSLTDVTDREPEKEFPRWASVSPDGRWAVFARLNDLYYMDSVNLRKARLDEKDSTIVEHRLTTDGSDDFSYGGRPDRDGATKKDSTTRNRPGIVWSPDSKRFAVTRADMSGIKPLWVINVLSNPRPTLEEYKYQMPGEPGPRYQLELFDMESLSRKTVKADAFKDQTLSINRRPVRNSDRYEESYKSVWLGDSSRFYVTRTSRDLKRVDICTVEVAGDSCRPIIEERLNTYVETRPLRPVSGGKELIHWSERNGWAHLYLYSADGRLLNPITRGDFHVEQIVETDDATRTVYFTACGYDKEENPYYTHLYRIGFDGSGMRRLDTPDFDSSVEMADDAKYFVVNYSRVDTAPVSDLCDNTGRKVMSLEEADLSLLFEAGYRFPERFKVKAGDGVTDLYGVMYKPFDFDSTRMYPLIEYVYPGPQTEAVNTAWSKSMTRVDRLAQLGFVVITVGNRGGHPNRSKWYHNYGYGNLRDYGLEDKKVAAQQLAARHAWIDGNRVGIHGHSGGGFMSTAAILKYPDFFKAAVSCAGNHDNSIYNRWWSEQHHGVLEEVNDKGDTTFRYSIDNNQSLAKNLKGHLLLVTGDIDNNVHPGNTIRVVDALIKANKRFEMLVLPGQRHGFGDMNEYFFWKMADFFSEHLLGDSQQSVDIPQLNND